MKLNQPYDKKRDLDNMIKFALDAGNGILYHDDSQIVHIIALKVYGPLPKTMIELKPYEEKERI